ncbi:uncharacterized protein ACR2FA_002533 [Aphomia sociella]
MIESGLITFILPLDTENMKFVLIAAAVLSVAVAGPAQRALVMPEVAGPAPIVIPDITGPAPIVVPDIAGPAPIVVPDIAGPAPIVVPDIAGPAPIVVPDITGPAPIVVPDIAGPAPIVVPELEPIVVAPVIIDEPSPVVVGPAIIDEPSPIAVGPAIIDSFEPVPAPVAESSAPLVQIILNINQAASGPVAVPPGVAITPEIVDEPIHIVETPVELPAEPVVIVDSAPEAVQVVDTLPVQIVDAPTVVEPVVVVETAPVPVEPVVVAPPSCLPPSSHFLTSLTKRKFILLNNLDTNNIVNYQYKSSDRQSAASHLKIYFLLAVTPQPTTRVPLMLATPLS